jgi:hypothetical protein
MTIAYITGIVSKEGAVTLAPSTSQPLSPPATISIGAGNIITINGVNQLSLDFSDSIGNFGTKEIKISSYTGTGTGRVYTLLGTVCSPDYKCTIDAVTEKLDFHYGSPSSTSNGLLGESPDTPGEIIVK